MPTAVAVFPRDITLRPLAERGQNVVQWAEFSRGGHFAALEALDLLVGKYGTSSATSADFSAKSAGGGIGH